MKKDFDLKKTALVIVDMQKGYCSPTGDLAKARDFDMTPMIEMAQRLRYFLMNIRGKIEIIWVRMEETPKTLAPNLLWAQQGKTITLCKRGTRGYEYFDVCPLPGEKEFHKNHYVLFYNTEIVEYLRARGIDTIIYVGVLTSRCVYASMVTGSALGFKSVILSDLVENPVELQAEKSEFLKVAGLLFARVMRSEDVVEDTLKMVKEQTTKSK
jgi:ureidoacrylate peracid hydrolase